SWRDEKSALEAVEMRRVQRVPASVNKLFRRGRLLGNTPLRRDLRGKKLYAGEFGVIYRYGIATAGVGRARMGSYEEAQRCDPLRPYDADALRAIALGMRQLERVRSPDEREAALRALKAEEWAARRRETTPGPFGDLVDLQKLLEW